MKKDIYIGFMVDEDTMKKLDKVISEENKADPSYRWKRSSYIRKLIVEHLKEKN